MDFSRFRTNMALRSVALFITLASVAWLTAHTHWYFTIALVLACALAQTASITKRATQCTHEVARFLEAIAVDDISQSFSKLATDSAYAHLGDAMGSVLRQLRASRSERAEQAQYLQTMVNHIPVALISVTECGKVQLINLAAQRLFETALTETSQFERHGKQFAAGIDALRAGDTVIAKMERTSGTLQLKAAATDLAVGGVRRRLVSLQNIESEMSAQEMVAWQTVIRVMAHEVMNSLTPVSSLAATALELVQDALREMPVEARTSTLLDAREALETVSRRSEGLLRFVENHHRLTRRLTIQLEDVPVQRMFARLSRLLANDLADRDIHMTTKVEPGTLEVTVDAALIDQALINLVRNAIEALRNVSAGHIALSAHRDSDGRIVIAVADNGPGIAPSQREKIFVPFFTTKSQGSGIGLTIVRQIATAHGAGIEVWQTIGGGATFSLRF